MQGSAIAEEKGAQVADERGPVSARRQRKRWLSAGMPARGDCFLIFRAVSFQGITEPVGYDIINKEELGNAKP